MTNAQIDGDNVTIERLASLLQGLFIGRPKRKEIVSSIERGESVILRRIRDDEVAARQDL